MEILWVFLIFAIYMLPAMIATVRDHPQFWAIMVLDMLLGWTLLGWVAALVWSLTAIPAGRKP